MNVLNSRFYNILESITNFFLLNVLWVICSLPIITFFPATTAMFGVCRQWTLKKDTRIFPTFLKLFKENFKQSFLIGLLWTFIVTILLLDLMIITQFESTLYTVLISGFILLSLIVIFTTIFIFPVIVNYQLNFIGVLRQSFLFSMMYFPTTILSIILLAITGFILFYFPMVFLFIISGVSYLLYILCHRKFVKVHDLAMAQS